MSADKTESRSSGQFVPCVVHGPTIEVDCSHWSRDPGARTHGQFVRRTVDLGVKEMHWEREAQFALELSLTLKQVSPSESIRQSLAEFVASLNDLVRALGGPGLTCESSKANGGPNTMHLSLRFNGPVSPAHADACRKHLQTVAASFKEIAGASATIKPAA